jgi:hypothetical protein
MKTTVNPKDTRFPKLTKTVLSHLDIEQLADVARHGADAGWSGFTYYTETVAFFRRHRKDIMALAKDSADAMGNDGMIKMIRNFGCLSSGQYPNRKPDYTADEVAEAIYTNRGGNVDLIQNAMAWFALEEIARELNPDV